MQLWGIHVAGLSKLTNQNFYDRLFVVVDLVFLREELLLCVALGVLLCVDLEAVRCCVVLGLFTVR